METQQFVISSFCHSGGCVEVGAFAPTDYVKSSFSIVNCVEVGASPEAFVDGVRAGEFNDARTINDRVLAKAA
jgi:hypothetical protein